MKSIKLFALTLLGVGLALAAGTPAQAQPRGDHPAYLHALEDLRLMRAYLDRLTPNEALDAESAHAIADVDAAIAEIKRAAIDDGKNPNAHPSIDARISRTDRFHRAREAGNAAWRDVNMDEDNGYANGLKHRALQHIESANHTIDSIIRHLEMR